MVNLSYIKVPITIQHSGYNIPDKTTECTCSLKHIFWYLSNEDIGMLRNVIISQLKAFCMAWKRNEKFSLLMQ